MAGIIGTKISPSVLIARMNQFCLSAAAALTSSFVPSDAPERAMNSSYTLLTAPVPMMI